jgi:formate/nitrite transporter FocA (FNT family)
MSTNVKDLPDQGVASLVGGIVHDAQHLADQQLMLLKNELRHELNHAKRAVISAVLGGVVVGIGFVLLLVSAAQTISAHSTIPLWGSYALVGGVTAAIGLVLTLLAKKEASDVHLVPPQTAAAMKENYKWIASQIKP